MDPEEATPIVEQSDVAGKPFYMPAATQLATIEPSPCTVPIARTRSPPLSDSHEPPNDVPLSVRTVCPLIAKVISGQLPSRLLAGCMQPSMQRPRSWLFPMTLT